MNFSRLFGADAEYMYYGLGLKPSVMNGQGLPDASGHMQSINLDGIVTVPRHVGKLAYGIFDIGFYDRHVSLAHSQFLQNGTPGQPAWIWWDPLCADYNPAKIYDPAAPYGATMSSNSKVAGGFNYGGGVTYRLNALHNAKLYLEWRYHRAYQSDVQTIVMPFTVGLRW